MTTTRQASRTGLALLGLALLAAAALLGGGLWLLGRDNDTAATSVESGAEPNEPEPDQTVETATAEEPTESEVSDVELATIIVRGETPQGWTIETPDQAYFYPVGPAGPEIFTKTESRGFAQTPEGAAFAAIHIPQRLGPVNPEWRMVAESQLVGPDVGQLVEELEELEGDDGLMAFIEANPLSGAVVGWDITSFDPQGAVVELGSMRMVNGEVVYTRHQVELAWIDGDWKVVIGRNDAARVVESLDDLDVSYREAFAL